MILLCGATGHLGRHVLKQLGSKNLPVRALVRTDRQKADFVGFTRDQHVGDLLRPQSLAGACNGIDTVISTAGASVHINTLGRSGFRAVDFDGNSNLLNEAKRAKVRKFVYISVLTTPELARTEYVKAKEDFAALVSASGLEYQILRPTGFFSAFADLITMARKGPLPVLGGGNAKTNPIDDEELATACLEAIDSRDRERSLGGPDVLGRREIIDLAFAAIGRKPQYRKVPAGVVQAAGLVTGLFNRRMRDLIEFYLAVSRFDAVAPAYGRRRLQDYFNTLAKYS